jgi:hypothetical protein
MPWVSNHSPAPITVSITATTGGNDKTFTIEPSIPYLIPHAIPETGDVNFWNRKGAEELAATIGGKDVAFSVQPNDHVTFYSDAYEIFTATVKFIA